MRRAKAFSTVNWRKYLDIKTNPRAKSFLESRGDDVLWQISSQIHQAAIKKGLSELVLLVHPNAGAVIRIEESDYQEVLEMSLNWFVAKENYSRCSMIQKFISNIKNKKIRTKKDIKTKETII